MGVNLFMAEFATQANKDRVMDGLPWMINKNVILLKTFDPSVKPSDVCFDRLSIWARILNLPFRLMNDSRGSPSLPYWYCRENGCRCQWQSLERFPACLCVNQDPGASVEMCFSLFSKEAGYGRVPSDVRANSSALFFVWHHWAFLSFVPKLGGTSC
jgi:hypothetical protein